ncbi:hypothetical protein CNR22_00690 [Sphingobacteriaceae bacterium]|nr:hypothetical protein CNR22_00690 [Sphingobacteriaceae bacterium]
MKKIKTLLCASVFACASCGTSNHPVQTATASDSVLESTPGSTPQLPDSLTVKAGPDQMIPANSEPLLPTNTTPKK